VLVGNDFPEGAGEPDPSDDDIFGPFHVAIVDESRLHAAWGSNEKGFATTIVEKYATFLRELENDDDDDDDDEDDDDDDQRDDGDLIDSALTEEAIRRALDSVAKGKVDRGLPKGSYAMAMLLVASHLGEGAERHAWMTVNKWTPFTKTLDEGLARAKSQFAVGRHVFHNGRAGWPVRWTKADDVPVVSYVPPERVASDAKLLGLVHLDACRFEDASYVEALTELRAWLEHAAHHRAAVVYMIR
jgi:hypothetical protein